jgi:hypothetical protein
MNKVTRKIAIRIVTMVIVFAVSPLLAAGEGPSTITVTSTEATGSGSLSEAITSANKADIPALIRFQLAEGGPAYDTASGFWTIRLAEPLPLLSAGTITLEGPLGPNGRPRVLLRAAREGLEYGLCIISPGNSVKGLSIGGFKHGIVLYGFAATKNRIQDCHVGTTASGDSAVPNETGVVISEGASENMISGCTISGNLSLGVYIGGKTSVANIIQGCRIGCDVSGTKRIPNTIGVMLAGASKNRIGSGGSGAGNIISGNEDIGVLMVGKWTTGNLVQGNLIGVDITGSHCLHNDKGVVIKSLANENLIGGPGEGDHNVISGNVEIGIYIEAADDNKIMGNLIGTDITGTRAVRTGSIIQGNGVEFNTVAKNNVLGGLNAGERNIISGNMVYGVVYYGHCERNNTVGNYIGVDITGEKALPNATGICVDCASHHNDIARNVISGNVSYGMFFVTRGTEFNTLRGNRIGTNATGDKAVPNDIGMVISTGATNNLVGGEGDEDRNIISGNRQSGIMITNRFTEKNRVEGNYIGVDVTGTKPIGNRHGIILATYPRANIVRRNVISANLTAGVAITEYAADNEVLENWIGTDRGGATLLPNAQCGIYVDDQSHDNLLEVEGQQNTLRNNPVDIARLPKRTEAIAAVKRAPLATPQTVPDEPHPSPRALDVSGYKQIVVTSARDSGPGTLRDAILQANRLGGKTAILFRIPRTDPGFDESSGIWRIRYEDSGPVVSGNDLVIDGYSQAASVGDTNPNGPEIVLDGNGQSVETAFLLLNVSNVTIRGFAIGGFLYGVQVYGPLAQNNRIVGNYIGTEADGAKANPNLNGVELLSGTHDTIIGGATREDRNLVSGNRHVGIRITDAHKNTVIGNFVGVDRTGQKALPNFDGICVEGRGRGNRIGGSRIDERNIVSGNVAYGVDLFGAGVQENTILGNFIGTDVTGTMAIPNTYGVLFDDRASGNVVGGTADGEWNLISGNTAFGGYFYNTGTNNNTLRGNRIGTDSTGKAAVPNEAGVHIDGGTFNNTVDQNVISGNIVAGITIFALHTDRNRITRNLIGADLSGTSPLPNGEVGIRIAFGPRDNIIGGSGPDGNLLVGNPIPISGEPEAIGANRLSDNTTDLGSWGKQR